MVPSYFGIIHLFFVTYSKLVGCCCFKGLMRNFMTSGLRHSSFQILLFENKATTATATIKKY
jgi:hypothetical protein